LRAYVRWLAGDEPGTMRELPLPVASPRVQVQASFNADGLICEQILQIMLEGLRNSRQHGQAKNVRMRASDHASVVSITISDDGTGFQQADPPPWTIASRVAEFGGRLNPVIIGKAQLEVEMPSTPGAPI
jgi:signal transduction histidine kinase